MALGKPNVSAIDFEKTIEGGYFGTQLGAGPRSKVGFHGKSGTDQYPNIANPTDLATAIVAINKILELLEQKGLSAE